MKKKPEKAVGLSIEHKEALASLAASPHFSSLEALERIWEHNIVYKAFKINSSDPDLARKKAHLEGQLYLLRELMKLFHSFKDKDG